MLVISLYLHTNYTMKYKEYIFDNFISYKYYTFILYILNNN